MKSFIPVENNDTLEAIRDVLRKLLESDIIDALMVPMRTEFGSVTPALVTDPKLLDRADPLAPVYPINSARTLGWMTQREPRGKIGAVMRSCEIRAMVELVKLKQACLDCITLISVDCAGTWDVAEYMDHHDNSAEPLWKSLYQDPLGAASDSGTVLRDACQMCERPVYDQADVVIELLGNDLEKGFAITLPDEMGQKLGLAAGDMQQGSDRSQVVEKLVAKRIEHRDQIFAQIREQLDAGRPGAGLEAIFSTCLRCHNCMTVCPICYCKTCLFKGPVFDHEPIQFMQWARQKGALRLPSDTTIFHLTRMNHMSLSCVGCGMCTSVCPVEIPVGRVFRAVGDSVQSVFDYIPGFNPEEKLPLVAFQVDEWQEVGE